MSQNSFVHQDLSNHFSTYSLMLHPSQVAGPTKSEVISDVSSRTLSQCELEVHSCGVMVKSNTYFVEIFWAPVPPMLQLSSYPGSYMQSRYQTVCAKVCDSTLNILSVMKIFETFPEIRIFALNGILNVAGFGHNFSNMHFFGSIWR